MGRQWEGNGNDKAMARQRQGKGNGNGKAMARR